jgi:23S rRNA-/tRNA-specific pseudouridylate synthase
VGDGRYGGGRPPPLELSRPWLHSEHLAFEHPITSEWLAFDSSLPADLLTFMRAFE